MNKTIRLTESRAVEVELSLEQARSIDLLGTTLASQTTGRGGEPGESSEADRSVISCRPSRNGRWQITVSNAIGAFGLDDITFVVEPKIPKDHVFYILSRSALLPRLQDSATRLAADGDLWELLATWFLERTTTIISRDLIRDYQSTYQVVRAVRGQVDAIPSAVAYYTGSLDLACTFDEFTLDNPFNRILLAGLTALQALPKLSAPLRRSSRRLASYFTEVGQLQSNDTKVATDRRSAYYEDALALARLIIRAIALSMSGGAEKAWTFLIRTPEAIEAGIREILREGLAPGTRVRKYPTALIPRTMRIEPDLRFDPDGAIGDVKYKLYGEDWSRADLYQNVAFAVGADTCRGCVISFASSDTSVLPAVRFKNIEVSHLVWDASHGSDPEASARQLVAACKQWLAGGLETPLDVAS